MTEAAVEAGLVYIASLTIFGVIGGVIAWTQAPVVGGELWPYIHVGATFVGMIVGLLVGQLVGVLTIMMMIAFE